jgi:alpha-tubulin suppressor-like RCC1 family protein
LLDVLAAVMLAILSGCLDFDQGLADFCGDHPHRCADAAPPDTTAPTIIQSSQSVASVLAHDSVTFSVTAHDEETSQLGFAWTASTGTLGSPSSTDTTSEVTWTAPTCVPARTAGTVTVTLTVTNGGDFSTSKVFTLSLSANPCPVLSVSGGSKHSLALLGDGTVWAWGNNLYGQLGDGTPMHFPVPTQTLVP